MSRSQLRSEGIVDPSFRARKDPTKREVFPGRSSGFGLNGPFLDLREYYPLHSP
jgi:hypothetical protein